MSKDGHRPKPVFIVGSGRSGTTLAATLINRFADVHIAKETGYISRAVDLLESIDKPESMERLVALTNSWLKVEGWTGRADAEQFRAFAAREGLQGAAGYMHYVWMLDSRRSRNGLSHVGDNTPGYVWVIPKLEQMLENARYIHVVRDPRDVAASILAMRFGANDVLTAALEWQANIGAWMAAERIVPPERRLEIRYEDLCRTPAAALGRVAAFLDQGIDAAEAALARTGDTADEFSAVTAKPHHSRLAEQLSPARIGAHRAALTPAQIAEVEAVTQHLMAVYGYEPVAWRRSPLMEDRRAYLALGYGRDILRKALRKLMP